MTHQRHERPRANGAAFLEPIDGPPSPEYDALADLFLGERGQPVSPGSKSVLTLVTSDEDERDETPVAAGLIEGLVIGHLPVLASAWVTQYARHVAERESGWVGLVRLRAGYASVELVGPPGTAENAAGVRACHSLPGALAEGSRAASRWLIRVDELTEAHLAGMPGMDAVTLLTGADEAAVVSSYRTLKLLGEHADDGGPRLGLAIMGAPAERAREASDRLARTVRVHLGREVPMTACVTQIGPGRVIAVYRGEVTAKSDEVLATVVSALRAARSGAAEPAAEAGPAGAMGDDPRGTPAGGAATPEAAPAALSAPEPVRDAPASTPAVLARHVAGLRLLPARCPVAPGVELAVDESGRTHALAHLEPGVLDQLLAASAWAGMHADWIRLAAGTCAGGNAIMHVLTDEPKSARRLLDSGVRVHLLARVVVRGEEAWVRRELN